MTSNTRPRSAMGEGRFEAPSWQVTTSCEIYSNGFFRLRRDRCALHEKPSVEANHYVLEMRDLVMVVPLTRDGKLVMVEQFRHGAGDWFLEFPGGSVDDEDLELDQEARRELLEETGCVAQSLHYLGAHYPNPGAQTNRSHAFLARNCETRDAQQLEHFEDIRVHNLSYVQLQEILASGGRVDSASLAALMLALPSLSVLEEFQLCSREPDPGARKRVEIVG